jgi:hypothetical protein
MSYEALLEELETLQKSMDQGDSDDEKIAAAAAAGDDDEDDDPDGGEGMGGEGDGDGDEGPMAKSFSFQLDTGEVVEAVDGTELVKSLQNEVALLKSERETAASQSEKVFQAVLGQLKSQGELIKSLSAQVEKLSSEGRGRKSVAAPSAAMAKSFGDPYELPTEMLLAKAEAALSAQKINGREANTISVACRHGLSLRDNVSPELLARVLA